MSAPTKDVSKWDLDDFMQFVESVGIKKDTTNYNKIKTTMEENSLSVSDVKGSAVSLASLFGIHKVIATKIQKPLYKLRLSEGINETINTPEHKQNNQKLNNSVNNNEKFCINFRGKQGKALTLRTLFTANDTIGSVAEAYKAEECVNQHYKVEKIILQSGGQVLKHDKKLSYYKIINENNLITVIFKTKGGANFASRTVEQWTTDDLQSWIETLNFQKDDEQKIIDAINDNGLTGGDLKDESCDDIAALLDISNELSKVLHDGFRNWKVIEDNVSDMKLNGNKDDQSDQSDMKYYAGYKLDCKDNRGMWCPAEVISVDSSFITVKFVNWENSKTRSQYHEDIIYCNEFAERSEKYGINTNQSSKAKAIIWKNTNHKYLNNNVCVYKHKRNLHPTKKAAKQIRKSQAEKLKKLVNNNEDTDNVSDMKLNENKDDQSDQSDMKYYAGYKLDCKDDRGFWCPAEVISVDSSFITVKFVHWTNSGTCSQYHENTIYCNEFAERLEKYGIITNQSSKAKAIFWKNTNHKYLNNNVCVYKNTRKFHPTKKAAKQIRKLQAEKLKKLVNNNESDGWMKHLTSYIPGYNSGYNGYNNGHNSGYNGYGIIGLRNLGNQCYMNSAIQLIVQTPPLLKLFRNTKNAAGKPLLSEFVDLCKAAIHSSSSYTPQDIKNILIKQDYASFGDYSQQDSGHALSTLLVKLDKELLDNKNYHSKTLNCIRKNGLDSDMEDALIEQIMEEYNPDNRSVIRDTMTFLFRKTYSCLAPNCDYTEWRYSLANKLVLPLENHCIIVPVQIYISNKVFIHQFNCVSYCNVSTLMAQIHDFLRNKNTDKNKTYDIHLYSVELGNQSKQLIDCNQILKPISSNIKCSDLINKVILVAAKSMNANANDNDNDNEMKEMEVDGISNIMMKQLCISIEQIEGNGKNRGKVVQKHNYNFYLNIVSVKHGTNINDVPMPSINNNGNVCIYYQGRILGKNDLFMVNELNDSMVIIYNERVSFFDDGYDNISNTWKYISYDSECKYKSMFDYNQIVQKLKSLQTRIGFTNFKNEEKKLNIAIECFSKMARNQQTISYYLTYALNSMNKCSKKFRRPLNNIDECLDAYLEEQVLDSGARVKCTNCNDYCKVFKQMTQIVRYPRIFTILFDRFDDGRKYDHKITFNKTMKRFNPCEYGLYGVCNHTSSSTDYGHYFSYVKSVDKNNSKWYNANDSSISAITNERKITDNRNALILMFEKK